ncbi:hypothetical protein ACVIHD_006410 [Bradyrhizobium embrapense]
MNHNRFCRFKISPAAPRSNPSQMWVIESSACRLRYKSFAFQKACKRFGLKHIRTNTTLVDC